MPKTKENKGVTLMTLIITIIVLLILTGVTIINIGGNEDTLRKAKAARDLNDSSNELEDIRIAVIHAEEKSFDGTVNADNLKIALNGVVSQEEINKITGNGPWIVNKNGRDYKIEDDGTVKKFVKEDELNSKIGQTVNYRENSGKVNSWRLFYASDEEVFLISSNVISSKNAFSPDGTNTYGIPLASRGKYSWDSTNNRYSYSSESDKYSGASDVFATNYGKKYNQNWYNTNSTDIDEKSKATAFLCDSSNWTEYVSSKAPTGTYAVGGPTKELLVRSWKASGQSDNALADILANTKALSTGYSYNRPDELRNNLVKASILKENGTGKGLYNSGNEHYWLASASSTSYTSVCSMYCRNGTGSVSENSYSNNTDVGARPIVSIPINNVDFSGENVIIKDDNGNQIQ
ncbi:MAG: hypothetical protein J6N78_03495 [Clostridia bacterium]|nr:hypothetical protein [Clostridia bacterium]